MPAVKCVPKIQIPWALQRPKRTVFAEGMRYFLRFRLDIFLSTRKPYSGGLKVQKNRGDLFRAGVRAYRAWTDDRDPHTAEGGRLSFASTLLLGREPATTVDLLHLDYHQALRGEIDRQPISGDGHLFRRRQGSCLA